MSQAPVGSLKLASLLLQYPTAELCAAAAAVEEDHLRALGKRRSGLEELLRWYTTAPLGELQSTYVETFDFSRQRSLHVTYHLHGDRRQRGIALLRLKQAYAAAGLEPDPRELPDYLPMMLEFATLVSAEIGRQLLDEQRIAIELIRASLRRDASRFTIVFDLIADQLPGLSSRQIGRLKRAAAAGPPTEQVGLEPFAPPEVIPDGSETPALPLVGGSS